MKVTAELRNWYLGLYGVYWGNIYGDIKGRWPDGRRIHTSSVRSVEDCGNHFLVITLNSVYKLYKDSEKKN